MSEEIVLTQAQIDTLNRLTGGKVDAKELDKRSINALEKRGLAKVKAAKKGTFVSVTAKGKKVAAAAATTPSVEV